MNFFADSIKVNMKCRCRADGFKTVNIIWLPLPQDQDSNYNVYFSTDTDPHLKTEPEYQFGCTVNTTQQSLPQNELQCSITSQTLFPLSFFFILELTNSSGVYVTETKTCRLASGKLLLRNHSLCPSPPETYLKSRSFCCEAS